MLDYLLQVEKKLLKTEIYICKLQKDFVEVSHN